MQKERIIKQIMLLSILAGSCHAITPEALQTKENQAEKSWGTTIGNASWEFAKGFGLGAGTTWLMLSAAPEKTSKNKNSYNLESKLNTSKIKKSESTQNFKAKLSRGGGLSLAAVVLGIGAIFYYRPKKGWLETTSYLGGTVTGFLAAAVCYDPKK
jgi:hypothetical protein